MIDPISQFVTQLLTDTTLIKSANSGIFCFRYFGYKIEFVWTNHTVYYVLRIWKLFILKESSKIISYVVRSIQSDTMS